MTYHYNHKARSRVATDTLPAHIIVNSLLDVLAIVLGTIIGGLAIGYSCAVYFFG